MPRLTRKRRHGAVLPMFALLLPVIFLLCGLAINTAHLKLIQTEMKISTDAAAHAGGRAMSIFQTTDAAEQWAEYVASLNQVGGHPLEISGDDVYFGFSTRGQSGFGRYEFDQKTKTAVDNGTAQANSISVVGRSMIPLAFRAIPNISEAEVSVRSIATQVDRDIALVLDRSGSMLEYKDADAMNRELYWDYRRRRISRSEYYDAARGPYRYFSSRVLRNLSGDMYEYAYDRKYIGSRAPRHSRWDQLNDGVDAFLDVLDGTDQIELVSLATFATNGLLNQSLVSDYRFIRNVVDATYPANSTAIGQGMERAIPSIMTAVEARPFAAKTIVILTDGINNVNPDPADVTRDLMAQYNATIHTVTFSRGADQVAMQEVADLGHGRHYHANDGDDLVPIFEEIANNLPTILSE